jgi:hypothetical protein
VSVERLPTIPHPTNPGFQLSSSAAVAAQKLIKGLFDENGKDIITGWALKQDRQVAGKPVFENIYTGERISWIPLQSANNQRGASWDIKKPCCHYNFESVQLDGMSVEIDGDGFVGVVDIFEDCPWGADAGQAINYYVVMVNGIQVEKQQSVASFQQVLKSSYRLNGQLHVLFSFHPDVKSVSYLQLSGQHQDNNCGVDSYSMFSSLGGSE